MSTCKKCGHEVLSGSKFCNNCGEKITDDGIDVGNVQQVKGKNKKFYIGIGIILLVAIVVLFILLFNNNSVNKFKSYIENGDYEKAELVFNDKIKNDTEKIKDVNKFVDDKIEFVKTNFIDEKINYELACTELDNLSKVDGNIDKINQIKAYIKNLNDSRNAYSKANAYIEQNDYINAINELDKVIKDDGNYSSSIELKESITPKYKSEVIKQTEKLLAENNIKEADKILKRSLLVLKDDADISILEEKINEAFKLEEEKMIQDLEKNQEVSVTSARIINNWLYDEMIEVIVKNNTEKVVKKYSIGWLAYDVDGFPIKTGWLSPDYLKMGSAEENIQPGKTHGSGSGWELDNSDVSTVLACVYEVEYYDSTKWTNPYFKYWEEKFKEKPLEK